LAFLPNTHLSPNDFQQAESTEESISTFKKKFGILNYFSESEDYEIRLTKGSN